MSNRTRGFASMDKARHRRVSAKGGRAMKPEDRSFFVNHDLARIAGAKGGKSVKPENRSFSRDPSLARRAVRIRKAKRASLAKRTEKDLDSRPQESGDST